MKKEEVDSMLSKLDVPRTDHLKHPQELKVPLLSYRKSSRAGLWLLAVPLTFPLVAFLKYRIGVVSSALDAVERFFVGIADHSVFTYLIPVIFVGVPLVVMVLYFLAFCHFASDRDTKSLVVTIKFRPLNIVVFLLSFAALAYAFLPDALPH
jgi:hypothetical protein